MNAEQFVDWLNGYLDAVDEPTAKNIQKIKDKLKEIKEDAISPSYPIYREIHPTNPFHSPFNFPPSTTCSNPEAPVEVTHDGLSPFTRNTYISC